MGKFRKGAKRPANAGRKPGSINKTTVVLREAVLLAAELEGDVSLQPLKKAALCGASDEEVAKRGGLVGYLRFLARKHPQAFTTLLGKVLPLQVRVEARTETIYRTVSEVRAELERRGIPLEAVAPLLIEADKTEPEDDDDKETTREAAGRTRP
jgi:hypothetical protein